MWYTVVHLLQNLNTHTHTNMNNKYSNDTKGGKDKKKRAEFSLLGLKFG